MCESHKTILRPPPPGASPQLGFSPPYLSSKKTRVWAQTAKSKAGVTCLSPRWREPLSLGQYRAPGTASEAACSGKGQNKRVAPSAWRRCAARWRKRPLPQTLPSPAPPSRVTIQYQPPRVVLLNGHFWKWPGRSRSPEPLGSHWLFPEPQGQPQGLSYSPGLHRSPCNKGLRPRRCINKGALSSKQESETVGGEEVVAAAVKTPCFRKSGQGSSS